MTRRVGLFGGSFDPVHRAHVALAEAALAALELDELRWIPAGQPWQKDRQLTPAPDREAMVRLAIAHEPRFVLDRIELDRAGPSYTIDTVQALAAAQPGTQWFLIVGQDQVAGLHTWKDWRALLGLVVLAVAQRPGETRPIDPEVLAMRQRVVPLAMQDISSTAVRERVGAGGDISKLVPPAVARYIDSHGLYRASPRS
jgi:nicotinate-nucleotide adenylyltransferase